MPPPTTALEARCSNCGSEGPIASERTYPVDLINDDRGIVWGEETIKLCEDCENEKPSEREPEPLEGDEDDDTCF